MNMLQALTSGIFLLPLPGKFSLFTRLATGFTLLNPPLRNMPVSLRFFAGGDRSVRGYAYQSLGPKNESGKVTGGKNLLVGSIEIERHIYKDWGIAVFYDAGNAFNSLSNITLFQGAGIGLRYYSPVGALKLDLARQIDVDNPRFRIHFSVGVQL
jgi:translocation and assembly module TamA